MNGFEKILLWALILISIGAFALFSFYLAIIFIPLFLVLFIIFGGLNFLASFFVNDVTVSSTVVKVDKSAPDIIDAQYEIIDNSGENQK